MPVLDAERARSTTCWSPPTRAQVFAGYLPYRTWDARPVAGSAGPDADELGPDVRPMGRDPIAEPLLPRVQAPHDARDMQAWIAARMIGEAVARVESARSRKPCAAICAAPNSRSRRVQGAEADAARLEPATAPADPARPTGATRVGLAAGGLSAPIVGTRHAGPRSAGDEMQTSTDAGRRFASARRSLATAPACAADRLCHQREGQFDLGRRSRQARRSSTTVQIGQRPRGIALSSDGKSVYVCARRRRHDRRSSTPRR